MPEPSQLTCPHLGLVGDRQSSLLYPDDSNRCYAGEQSEPIGQKYQEVFCLGGRYETCPRYVTPSAQPVAVPVPVAAEDPVGELPTALSLWRVLLWGLVGVVVVLVAVYYGVTIFTPPAELTPAPTLTRRPTVTPAVVAPVVEDSATPLHFSQPTATPTPPPGGANFALSPAAGGVGWVVSEEGRGNHFGDSNVYAGVFDGQTYHGAIQFDLAAVPRGAPIYAASLQLTGLNAERLGNAGVWEVRILTDTLDTLWPAATYQDIHNAAVLQSLSPALAPGELGARKVNAFELNAAQLELLQQRVLAEGKLSLRVDGPLAGVNSLFSWDSGYGPESQGLKPALFLSVGAPPATPPPREYVVVTNTPTPENVLTAAAEVARMTLEATTTGTPTPAPRNLVTATPAELVVVTNTPEPGNAATAQHLDAVGTAMALTTGTATATPENMVTATPSPTLYVVTSVPTPANLLTAMARAVDMATAVALQGTATPLPANWVTPMVLPATPTAGNAGTAVAMVAQATIQALLQGTPTPLGANVVTVTPTPWIAVGAVVYPTPSATATLSPTPNPYVIPDYLIGRIGFMSDRDGGEPGYYVMDADGSNVQRLTGPDAYEAALVRDTLDPTGKYQAIVTLPRGADEDAHVGDNYEISLRRLSDGYEQYLTGGTKGADYNPAYCQAQPRYIAFTSQQSDYDDIFVLDLLSADSPDAPLRTTRLTTNDWPWDKHPSWSTDCGQIVYFSNQDGQDQIYLMDFWGMDYTGQNLRNISQNPYNDWDPVWFKAPPARP